jgi:hypothetical protein
MQVCVTLTSLSAESRYSNRATGSDGDGPAERERAYLMNFTKPCDAEHTSLKRLRQLDVH